MLTLSIVSQFTFDTTLATKNQFNALLHGPSLAYPFGTDDFGRDLFTRVVVGTKLTFSISIISVRYCSYFWCVTRHYRRLF